MIMKCHTCQKSLEPIDRDTPNQIVLECPDIHLTVTLINNDIASYTMYWDADENATNRYKLISSSNQTTLKHAIGFDDPRSRWRYYKTVMTLPQMLPLIIKDNIVQCDNLIPRLQKLKAFI
jgi:hypothetical protein